MSRLKAGIPLALVAPLDQRIEVRFERDVLGLVDEAQTGRESRDQHGFAALMGI